MQVRQTSNSMGSFNQPFANLQFAIISFLSSILIPLQSSVFVFIIINILKLETVMFETRLKTTNLTSSAPRECSMNHKWISVG